MLNSELYKQVEDKYLKLGTNPSTHLTGVLYAKEIDYWSYIQLDTLLI